MTLRVAEIDLGALLQNFREAQRRTGPAGVAAVVKANAYGHGAVAVARALEGAGARMLAVSLVEEGVQLREAGLRAPILVMGATAPSDAPALVAQRLVPALSDLGVAEALSREAGHAGRTVAVHLKVDTGMGRLGFGWREAVDAIRRIGALPHLRLEGVMSHLADADLADLGSAREQIRRFQQVRQAALEEGHKIDLWHLSNSAATLRLPEAHFGMVRPGLMLYGYATVACGGPSGQEEAGSSDAPTPRASRGEAANRLSSATDVVLRPVLTLKARIVHLKEIAPGETVGYGRTFVARRPTRIAVIPVGYADGYSRALSNRASVLVAGRRAPVAGRVCMDMTMLDVTDLPAAVGDEAVLIGSQEGEQIGADELASLAGTIPYEILCAVHPRIPRVYITPRGEGDR